MCVVWCGVVCVRVYVCSGAVLLFCFFCFVLLCTVLRESHCVSLAGLKFRDLPDSVFQVLGLKKGICHHTQQINFIKNR